MLSSISFSLLKNTAQGALGSKLGSKFTGGRQVAVLCRKNRITNPWGTQSNIWKGSSTHFSASFNSPGSSPLYSWKSSRITTRAMSTSVAARIVPVAVAKELLEAGHHYLDVRTPDEFAAGHADGAVNIPYMFKKDAGMIKNDNFLDQVAEKFNKDDELVVACQSGRRSAMAAAELINAEYTNVADVDGGFSSWVQSGLPVSK